MAMETLLYLGLNIRNSYSHMYQYFCWNIGHKSDAEYASVICEPPSLTRLSDRKSEGLIIAVFRSLSVKNMFSQQPLVHFPWLNRSTGECPSDAGQVALVSVSHGGQ